MPFLWAGCLDGSSVNMAQADAFTVGQVQKHSTEGQPLFEDNDPTKPPILTMCVFAVFGGANFPVRIVESMHEAQVTIQSLLGKLKSEYDKERGVIQVASAGEKAALKLG